MATIRRHCEGYLRGMGNDIKNFFARRDEPSLMGLHSAAFIARLLSDGFNTAELDIQLPYTQPDDIINYLKKTDWEFAYLVDMTRRGLMMTVLSKEKIVFSGPLNTFICPSEEEETKNE